MLQLAKTLRDNVIQELFLEHSAHFFGEGTGTIALNFVSCLGTEARLVDCSSGTVTSCSHSEDAGVTCHVQTGTNFLTNVAGKYLFVSRLQ